MAETSGLVQQLKVYTSGITIALVGPNINNVTTLQVTRVPADSREAASAKDDMVSALAAAQVAYREVVAVHGDTSSDITQLRIEPV
jgi:hypothetical protein